MSRSPTTVEALAALSAEETRLRSLSKQSSVAFWLRRLLLQFWVLLRLWCLFHRPRLPLHRQLLLCLLLLPRMLSALDAGGLGTPTSSVALTGGSKLVFEVLVLTEEGLQVVPSIGGGLQLHPLHRRDTPSDKSQLVALLRRLTHQLSPGSADIAQSPSSIWILDSRASFHMTPDSTSLTSTGPLLFIFLFRLLMALPCLLVARELLSLLVLLSVGQLTDQGYRLVLTLLPVLFRMFGPKAIVGIGRHRRDHQGLHH